MPESDSASPCKRVSVDEGARERHSSMKEAAVNKKPARAGSEEPQRGPMRGPPEPREA